MIHLRRGAKTSRARRREADDLSGYLVTLQDPAGAAAEAYRFLRTSLLYAVVDAPPQVILLTSAGPREGKSMTCANLGVTLAQAGKSVLVIDCDLRTPVMHKVFGLHDIRGVVNVLAGEYPLQEAWQEALPGLKVMTTGAIPPDPAELLSSKRFAQLLDQARQEFDYVLMDAPPLESVSVPATLATQSDGVLFVLDAQRTGKATAWKSLRTLRALGANVLGTVMNNAKRTTDT